MWLNVVHTNVVSQFTLANTSQQQQQQTTSNNNVHGVYSRDILYLKFWRVSVFRHFFSIGGLLAIWFIANCWCYRIQLTILYPELHLHCKHFLTAPTFLFRNILVDATQVCTLAATFLSKHHFHPAFCTSFHAKLTSCELLASLFLVLCICKLGPRWL